MTAIKSTAALGFGVMGFDIAFLYALKGYRTLAYDAAKLNPLDSLIVERALKAVIHAAAARVVELGEDPRKTDFISVEAIKISQAPLKEIDATGPAIVLQEIQDIDGAVPLGLNPPRLLVAMAEQGQSFYRGEEPRPWIGSAVEQQRAHARH